MSITIPSDPEALAALQARIAAAMERSDHNSSIETWASFLRIFKPGEYRDPRPPPPARTETRSQRVALLTRRRAKGWGLWCRRDVICLSSPWGGRTSPPEPGEADCPVKPQRSSKPGRRKKEQQTAVAR